MPFSASTSATWRTWRRWSTMQQTLALYQRPLPRRRPRSWPTTCTPTTWPRAMALAQAGLHVAGAAPPRPPRSLPGRCGPRGESGHRRDPRRHRLWPGRPHLGRRVPGGRCARLSARGASGSTCRCPGGEEAMRKPYRMAPWPTCCALLGERPLLSTLLARSRQRNGDIDRADGGARR